MSFEKVISSKNGGIFVNFLITEFFFYQEKINKYAKRYKS